MSLPRATTPRPALFASVRRSLRFYSLPGLLIASFALAGCTAPLPSTNQSVPSVTSLTASPTTITAGASTTLSWTTTGATGITIAPGNYSSPSADGSMTVNPTATTTYTITATNSTGTTTKTVVVTVAQPSQPTISSFTASPSSISVGAISTLSWSTSGASTITITPGTYSTTNASGTTGVSPAVTTTYVLTATNAAGSATASVTVSVPTAAVPTINSFSASPTSIVNGAVSTLSWSTSGASTIAITPGSFTSASASGSTSVTPSSTTTYTLTATNAAGSNTSVATVTVSPASGALKINTTSCPGGTQNTGYAGCTISASGGTPPYTFSVTNSVSYPPLPEGMSINAQTGIISSTLIGAQGTYVPQIVVTDSASAQATQTITFAINGSNAFLANLFPADSIFRHRVDAATTGLPVDTSPAANIYSGYLPATIKPFFGNAAYLNFPNGIPAIEVPATQPDVADSTTTYQSYFNSGPIPSYAPVEGTSASTGDRHVLVYLEAGTGTNPALYEMWQGVEQSGGSWIDSSNALWPNTSTDDLTPQGTGTADAAGLPIAPLLVNADEVIGTGTPSVPTGSVQHPIRFTVNHMLNEWVWPGTQSAGTGSCIPSGGGTAISESEISQSAPPASCTMSGPAREIYRLKASVATPACAGTSPQAAIIITAFRNYGIILADNGTSGGLIGTPDARWNDSDLQCLENLTLGDFEPVNVSSLIVSNSSGATSH